MPIFYLLLFNILIFSNVLAAENTQSPIKDLKKKTLEGFSVPYALRYDPEKWSGKHFAGFEELHSISRKIHVIIAANKADKNQSREILDELFFNVLKKNFSDPELFSKVECKDSEYIIVNGISLLHQSAIINLAPNSSHRRKNGNNGWLNTIVPENGSQKQMDYYIYSDERGTITICFESPSLISKDDQKSIDELFDGFSLDGSASRGPAKLRGLKTFFETVSEELTK